MWDTRNLNRALRVTSGQYGQLAVRAVVLVGDHDRGRAESRRLASATTGAELQSPPGAGHQLPRTRPAAISAAAERVAARAAPAHGG